MKTTFAGELCFSKAIKLLFNRGNYHGVAPYRTGSPCSGCGQETCEIKICRKCQK